MKQVNRSCQILQITTWHFCSISYGLAARLFGKSSCSGGSSPMVENDTIHRRKSCNTSTERSWRQEHESKEIFEIRSIGQKLGQIFEKSHFWLSWLYYLRYRSHIWYVDSLDQGLSGVWSQICSSVLRNRSKIRSNFRLNSFLLVKLLLLNISFPNFAGK